jgi:hypothetical protein
MVERNDPLDQLVAGLGDLYRRDPARFEVVSRELIRRTIESFPPERRQRALGMQFRLEATLNRYRDPVARMNKMVEILWEHLRQFQEALNDPGRVLAEREAGKTPGKVIPFPRSKKLH